MQQITRKVSCSYTMQNKQKWTRNEPKTESKYAVQGCPFFFPFFCWHPSTAWAWPSWPKNPINARDSRTTRAREFCLTFSVFMLTRICSWHHYYGPHCVCGFWLCNYNTLEGESGVRGISGTWNRTRVAANAFFAFDPIFYLCFLVLFQMQLYISSFSLLFCFVFLFCSLTLKFICKLCSYFIGICFVLFCFCAFFGACNVSAIWISFIGFV